MESPSSHLAITTLIAGMGGQGVVLAGDVLAEAAIQSGLNVKKSEIHGLSRRFGSVSCQVRIGHELHSPLRGHKAVDLLLALEGYEGLKHLPFLNDTGSAMFNRFWRKPGAASPTASAAPEIPEDERIHWTEGTALTHQAECPRSLNFFMLGVVSSRLPIPTSNWLEALHTALGPKDREVNGEMFLAGQQALLQATPVVSSGLVHQRPISGNRTGGPLHVHFQPQTILNAQPT